MTRPWQIALDVGGTFTDAVAVAPDGSVHTTKVLSSGVIRVTAMSDRSSFWLETASMPPVQEFLHGASFRPIDAPPTDACVIDFDKVWSSGAHQVRTIPYPPREWRQFGDTFQAIIDPGMTSVALAAHLLTQTPLNTELPPIRIRLGTTRGTNALLERAVSQVLFVTNHGHEDLLRIGDQRRPELFALHIERDPPPHAFTVGIQGRLDASGRELEPLDEGELRRVALLAHESGCSAVAVCLMHSWVNPAHEDHVRRILHGAGIHAVSLGSALSRTIGFEARARTTCINAQLARPVADYLRDVRQQLDDASILVMTSAGTLAPADDFTPKDSLFSGPAGGVAGARAAAMAAGTMPAIAFDMGGTSTDVARLGDDPELNTTTRVGAAHIASPSVAVDSVAAGGGSVLEVIDGQPCVGPRSAGSMPGPACYGMGGPLTITDAHLLLGHLDGASFPFAMDRNAAAGRASDVCARWNEQRGESIDVPTMLRTFLAIANERMAEAIRRVSARRGLDPAAHTLLAFGGAGGLHACALAELLGMRRVVIPGRAGLLSAQGIGTSRTGTIEVRSVRMGLAQWAATMQAEPGDCLGVRPAQQEAVIEVPATAGGLSDLRATFAGRYRAIFGFDPPRGDETVEWIRHHDLADDAWSLPLDASTACTPTPHGFAMEHCTVVVPEGWTANPNPIGLVLERTGSASAQSPVIGTDALVAAALHGAAESMGESLRATAVSVNVRDRLDYSCGLVDVDGALIVNAPHLPVHLGALGACVRAVAATLDLGPGDAAVTNHPAFGGSHLPDVTVVTPVFERPDGGTLLGYAATRAHHAELGGIAPGSMPPFAASLAEEAVVLPPTLIVCGGIECFEAVTRLLRESPHPSRAVQQNLDDLRAQVAANHTGVVRMRATAARFSEHFMPALATLRSRARQAAVAALAGVPEGTVTETLDDGTPICVRLSRTVRTEPGGSLTIDPSRQRITIDFTGSGAVHPGNFNAPFAVIRSATLYALRVMAGAHDELRAGVLPLNEGFLDAVDLIVPHGFLNPVFQPDPAACPAVGAGNTETSQRVVDALLRLLGAAACSQGTMNNLIFGSDRFGFYETIAGGAGATARGDGASGVHTHMTNTRITDAELLESRYPVRLVRFALRRGSSGAGLHTGGEGVVRELEFLEPVTCSIIGQHRTDGPYGIDGGRPGAVGEQWLMRGAMRLPLPGVGTSELQAGDRVAIHTPGGGGWGPFIRPEDLGADAYADNS
jgi:5-oxoprolinase (ATP-hydrolysing)